MGYSLPPLAFFEITPVHKHTESLIMPLSVQLETPHSGKYEQPAGLFINNEFVKGAEGKTFEVINPSTEEVITSVHEATEKDIDIAVAAARKAFEGPWRKETPENRGKLIVKLANLFEENLDLLAAVESLDNGKAINMAKVDISMCVGCLRYYGGWADKIEGRVIDTNPDTFNYAKKEPIGVCAQIIPWNFPLLMWAWKIGPAIACGNTVVLKTAEQTPLGGLVAAKLIKEAGFPPGVVNIISGFGKIAGAALSSHMDIDKVAFTGSTVVGRQILKAAASSNLKKVTLETGGKRKGDKGYFIEPTIFSNVTEDMKIVQEEIFGPVCSIAKFKTKEEAIKLGNDTTYGLAAAVHTKNLNTTIEVSSALRAGTVWVNTYNTLHHQLPFGGYKESGIGRELGEDALANYTQTKTVSIRLGDALFG